jgi:hypothetical protein
MVAIRTSPVRRAAVVVAAAVTPLAVPALPAAGTYGLVVVLAMAAALAQQTLP